jgi:hypothetical protein
MESIIAGMHRTRMRRNETALSFEFVRPSVRPSIRLLAVHEKEFIRARKIFDRVYDSQNPFFISFPCRVSEETKPLTVP